ncbi:oxidation resistance protein 1 [Mortierella sp. GBA43]|nr:oxidation resistance protein 1 [Mortierella sp. GBA43]
MFSHQQQPKWCKVQTSEPKTRSLPATLSDYYIGEAPSMIPRAHSTTAIQNAEDYMGTQDGLKMGVSARQGRWPSVSRLFAKDRDYQTRIYAAAAAAQAAVTPTAAATEPSDEDDVVLVHTAKSTAWPRGPKRSPAAPLPKLSMSHSSCSSLPPSPRLQPPSPPPPALAPQDPRSASAAAPHAYPSPTLATTAAPAPIAPQEQRTADHPQAQQQAQLPLTPARPLSSCPSLLHNHPSPSCSENNSAFWSTSGVNSHRRASQSSSSPPAPIVIHRSRSIAVLSSSASSAVNISPVECASLSPSTASAAEAIYLSAKKKKRSSSLFASLSAPKTRTATQHYQAPDYLTAFFAAETSSRPTSSTQDNRFRSTSEPASLLATATSASPTSTPTTTPRPSTDSAHQHLYHSRHHSLEKSQDTGQKYYTYRHKKAPSNYQPIMIPRKTKQNVLELLTTEKSKHGYTRSTQSTVNGGDWGEPSMGGYNPQGIAPNSPGVGQDSWTVVTGSGYDHGAAPLSSEARTPLSARQEQINKLPPLQLLDRNQDSDPVLDLEIAQQIRIELPRKLRNGTKWNLVYSSDQHGISMTTLYHRCKGKGPMILAIKDTTNAVFGAFVNEELKTGLSYYGTGEWAPGTAFTGYSPAPSPKSPIFSINKGGNNGTTTNDHRYELSLAMNDRLTVEPRSPSFSPSGSQGSTGTASSTTTTPTTNVAKRKKKQKVVQFWKWTGKNNYVILSEPGFIGFGGGDGKFGLWIHSDLERGHSERCATFDNEPLAAASHHPLQQPGTPGLQEAQKPGSSSPKSDKNEFYCQTIEIWSIAL